MDLAYLRIEIPPMCLEYTQNKGAETEAGKVGRSQIMQGQEEQWETFKTVIWQSDLSLLKNKPL